MASHCNALEHLEASGTEIVYCMQVTLTKEQRDTHAAIEEEFQGFFVCCCCSILVSQFATLAKFKIHWKSFCSQYLSKPPFRELRSCQESS